MIPANEPKQSGSADADQAEIDAIQNGLASITAAANDEKWSGEALDEAEGQGSVFAIPAWEMDDRGEESIAGSALEVISLRKKLLGDDYPFDIDRASISYTRQEFGMYEYLLATSKAASIGTKKNQMLVRHFERVTKSILIAYSGKYSVGVRFGWPSEKDHENPPKRFDRKVSWMKNECGYDQTEWTFDHNPYLADTRKNAKDAKIDVIVRRPYGDGRVGALTFLGQCGCGKNDVDDSSSKHSQLNKAWLDGFFSQACLPPYVIAFFTSQHITQNSSLYEKQLFGQTLVMDRIRIMTLVKDYPEILPDHLPIIQKLTRTYVG